MQGVLHRPGPCLQPASGGSVEATQVSGSRSEVVVASLTPYYPVTTSLLPPYYPLTTPLLPPYYPLTTCYLPTQGSSYAEFAILAVECTNATYYYEDTGYMTPWPVVRYRIRLKRASSYYVPGYVALPILLTVRAST